MNIWNWITKRVLRLPQRSNSVSDIIGASNWNAIKTTVTTLIQTAISEELTGFETVALVDANKLTGAVIGVFKGVNPTFQSAIQSSISASIKSSIDKSVVDLQTVILGDLARVIGLI